MHKVPGIWLAFWISLSVTTSVAARAQAPSGPGERRALLVGVRQYDPNELRSLPYAEPDVIGLARVLKGAGYRQVVTLTQSAGADNFRLLPTGANIRTTLKGILEDREPGDTVLVAFAGHGVQFQGTQESFFCPMDARLADRSTLVSLADIYRAMEQSQAGIKVLLADSCRNDPLSDNSRSRAVVRLESVTRPQDRRPPGGVAALFSCSPGEKAYEHDRLKHGVSYYYVIEGLSGAADLDRDGTVSIEELALYAKRRVPDFVKEEYGFDVRQIPVLRGEVGGLMGLVELNRTKVLEKSRPPLDLSKTKKMEPVSKHANTTGQSTTNPLSLTDSIAQLLTIDGTGRESIGLGLMLAGSVTSDDLRPLMQGMKSQGARIMAITTADPTLLDVVQRAVARSSRQCVVNQDYRSVLDRKDADVTVVIGYLRNEHLFDLTFGANVPGAMAIERIVSCSARAGKDCYVARSPTDVGHWIPDLSRTSHPTAPAKPEALSTYTNPIQELRKFNRIASFAELTAEDFEAFLRCVKSREKPPHGL